MLGEQCSWSFNIQQNDMDNTIYVGTLVRCIHVRRNTFTRLYNSTISFRTYDGDYVKSNYYIETNIYNMHIWRDFDVEHCRTYTYVPKTMKMVCIRIYVNE